MYLIDRSYALATSTQNSSRNVVTEHRREISRKKRETFALSELKFGILGFCTLRRSGRGTAAIWEGISLGSTCLE